MGYVYAGTRLTVVCTWNETGVVLWTSGVSDVLAKVSADLQNLYQCRVERSNVVAPAVAVGSITETITLNLYTSQDRNDSADILDNVNGLFAQYGSYPSASDITSITPPATAPDSADSGDTGAPGPVPATPSNTIDWWNNLKTELGAGSVGFVAGGLVVVGLLVFIAVKAEV